MTTFDEPLGQVTDLLAQRQPDLIRPFRCACNHQSGPGLHPGWFLPSCYTPAELADRRTPLPWLEGR